MAKSRCQILADEVYQQAFDLLDAEPGVTGYEAGRAATQTKKAFERSCKIMRPTWNGNTRRQKGLPRR